MRPACIASRTGATANSAISTPTVHALRPSRSAISGDDMRKPAIAACRPSWPTISANSTRVGIARACEAGSDTRSFSFDRLVGIEQVAHPWVGQRLDALEPRGHHARALLGESDRVLRFLQLLLRLGQHVAELLELGLHATEHLPHLGTAALERERAKAHLQAVERGQQRGRPGQ